uniref:Putative secreted protein n=1 Tax=Amblyomma triste TaxID=251400 RepID=A0A023G0L0_AMBTT
MSCSHSQPFCLLACCVIKVDLVSCQGYFNIRILSHFGIAFPLADWLEWCHVPGLTGFERIRREELEQSWVGDAEIGWNELYTQLISVWLSVYILVSLELGSEVRKISHHPKSLVG